MANSTSNSPGVFRGNARLASQQDLAILRQELEYLIAGDNELSEHGYIPLKYTDDGSLDIDELFPELVSQFKESTGLSINKNGFPFCKDIKTIDFRGNYVDIHADAFGNLVCEIRPPKEEISRFNGVDGITDARIKIKNTVIDNMIIPDASASSTTAWLYGDWEPGDVRSGFNWNGNDNYDILTLYTSDSVFATSDGSYFEVSVYDATNGVYHSTFVSKPVCGTTPPKESLQAGGTGNNFNPYIKIYITEFGKATTDIGYAFKPVFEINLKPLMPTGGRFKIKITHQDSGNANTYLSQDFLYNVGVKPSINDVNLQIISDESLPPSAKVQYECCSGLKYVKDGKILLAVNSIRNLNKMAAVDKKIEYKFDIADQHLLESKFTKYDFTIDKVASWETELYLNKETFNNKTTSGYIIAKNAFGESNVEIVNVPVLLNSISTLKYSDNLNEYFNDEGRRVLHNFQENYVNGSSYGLVGWDGSQSLLTYDDGFGLMVTPTVGLTYPSGDWSGFFPKYPSPLPDYSGITGEKFFARTFTGNSRIKYGGIFEISGLTKEQFLNNNLSMIISPDKLRWYSLKHVRGEGVAVSNGDTSSTAAIGVLTKINEVNGKLQICWMYPGTTASSNNVLYFKLGMNERLKHSEFCIKSISLLNSDGTEDW
jgi:hypothetical protein